MSEHEPADEEGQAQPGEAEPGEAERRFLEGLVIRGEVVPEGTEPLPPDATHEAEEEGGVPPKVRRRRFSSH